jgi:acetolactate synthase-1/2/3 large subunit
MKRTGGWLVVRALEQLGVQYTFGVPGVHNTEIYDALADSEQITPILVTHEGGATFMADAVSRTTGTIGCAVIVPAAGVTHAMSGIGEAYLAGIPLLVITGGIRRDTGKRYQLHDVDQQRILDGIVKAAYRVDRHADVLPTIFAAYEAAMSGEPGPVFVEVSGEVLVFSGRVDELPAYERRWRPPVLDEEQVGAAANLLESASRPGIYLGWGARDGTATAIELAELLGAPVATTLQGVSVFPADHPLHTGMGFGPSAVPAARKAFAGCDCLLAVGARFGEIATASYGMKIPGNLIHVDINAEVFGRNYPAAVAIEADAGEAMRALNAELRRRAEASGPAAGADPGTAAAAAPAAGSDSGTAAAAEAGPLSKSALSDAAAERRRALSELIRKEKQAWADSWTAESNGERVSPGVFFRDLRARLAADAYLIVDDGNHTFLAVEQFPVLRSKHFLSPTDFNCMGYSVPAAIGVKLTHQQQQVVAVVGDGALLMTGLEILTASTYGIGAVFFVFHDGELAQISQFQEIPLNRKTCSVLGDVKVEGIATATGAAYLHMESDAESPGVIDEALRLAAGGQPVLVDVNIDYSRKTAFTKGVVKVNFGRFPLRQKLRFLGRALKRHLLGGD